MDVNNSYSSDEDIVNISSARLKGFIENRLVSPSRGAYYMIHRTPFDKGIEGKKKNRMKKLF